MRRIFVHGAVTRVNRVTSVGQAPAGRLDDVAHKRRLCCSSSARGRGEIGRRRRLKIAFPWSAGSSPAVRTILTALALAGCRPAAEPGTITVSVIGGSTHVVDAGRAAPNTSDRLLTATVAQGLVRFDAAGAIEPGLAERWIVTDGGTSYIFRLSEARWPDGSPVTTTQVVQQLRRQLAPGSRNPLKPFLTAIDEVVAMTPQVIEVSLDRPRPDLLKLFAQPELAIQRDGGGTGPLRPAEPGYLRTVPDPSRVDGDGRPLPDRTPRVRLIGETAARAIARFAAGRAELVAGGGFADWPLIQLADLPPAAVRVDPAAGLFGLSFADRDGFLTDPANRAAVAQAIDGAAAVQAVATGWVSDERLLPDRLDSAAAPAQPSWAATPLPERIAAARQRVAAFGKPVRLRIALPSGPGATRLWGQIARALLGIGITPERVGAAAPADLRLVDAVAPYDSARWYLATACQPCGADAQAKLEAAREAPTLAERAQRLAEADAALTADVAFIPLARPWRWSLVAPRLRGWQPNARAAHPLNHLLADPT